MKTRGFTLIELLIVLVIISLLVAMAAMVTRAITSQQRRSLTSARLAGVDAALTQYVVLQKRLPCPADGSLNSATVATAGIETARTAIAGCTTDQAMGVVPWRALGVSEEDITDGWGRRITYRTNPAMAVDNAMDMSKCDPAGTDPTLPAAICNVVCSSAALGSCTPPASFLSGKGLEIRRMDGVTKIMDPAATPPTGAAYVLISHGETGGGGYLNTGSLYTSTTTDGTQEARNYGSAAYAVNYWYVDDQITDAPGATTHFDDLVSRPSLLTVINKASLGPRSH